MHKMTVANNYHDHSFFYLNNRTMLEEELTYFQSNDLSSEPTAAIDNKNMGDYKTNADTFSSNENKKNDVLMNGTLNGIKLNKITTSPSVVNNNTIDSSDGQNDTNIIDKKANKRNSELGKNSKVSINNNNTKDNINRSNKIKKNKINNTNNNNVSNNKNGININSKNSGKNINLLNNSITESSSCNMYDEIDFKSFDSSINSFNYAHSINNKLDLKGLNNIMKYSNNSDKNKQLYAYNDSHKACCTSGNGNESIKLSENNLIQNYNYTDCYNNETNDTNISTCSTGNNIYKNIEKSNHNNSNGFNHNSQNSSDDNICKNKKCEKNSDSNMNENSSTNNDGIGDCDRRKIMEENNKNEHGSEGNDDKGDNKNKNKNTNNSKGKGNSKGNKNKNGNKKNKKNGNQNGKINSNNNGEDKTDQKNDTSNGKYLHGNTSIINNKTLKHNTETNNISITSSNKSANGNSGSKKSGNNIANLIISDKYSTVSAASTTNTNNNQRNASDYSNENFEKNNCACTESNSILFQDRDIKYDEKSERIIICDNDNNVASVIDENKSNDIVNLNNTINLLKNNIYNAFNDTFSEKTTESIYFSKNVPNNDMDKIIENTGNLKKKKKKKIQNNNIIDSNNNMSPLLSHTQIPIFDAGMNQISHNILQNKFGLNDEKENHSMTSSTYTSTSINDGSITQLHNGLKLSLVKTYDINKTVDNSTANNYCLNINMGNNTLNTTNQSTEINENVSTRFSQSNSLNQHKETNANYNRYNNEKSTKENGNSLNLRKGGNNNMSVERPVILNNSQMLQAFMQGRLCLSCDSLDHPMPLCPNNSFVCPNCHNISHRGNDCPMKCRFCLKYHNGISIMDCLKKARIQNEKKLLNKGKNDNNNSTENNNKMGKNNKNNNEKPNIGPRFDITTRPDNSYGRSVYVSNLSDEITNAQLRDAINNQLDNGFVVNIDRQNGYAFVELSNLNSTFQLVQRSININYKKLKIQFKKTGQFLIPDNLSFNSNNVSSNFNLSNNDNTQNKSNKTGSNSHASNKNSSTSMNSASNLGTIQNNFISNHIHFDFSTQIKDSNMKKNANIVNNVAQNDTNNITVNTNSNSIINNGHNNYLLHLDNMEGENGGSAKFYYETQRKSQIQQFNQASNLKKYKQKGINNLYNNISGNCSENIIDAHFSSKVLENLKKTAQLNERNEGGNNLLCKNSNQNIKLENIGINNYCNKNGNIDNCSNYQIKDLSNYYNMNKINGRSDNLIKQNNFYDFMSIEDENILNDYLKKKNINLNNSISSMDIANMEERNNSNFNDNMFLKFINHITNDQNKLNNTIINERTKAANSTINNNSDTLLNSHLFNNRSLLLKENNNYYNNTIEDSNVPDLSSNIYLKNDNNLTEYNSSTDDNMIQKYIHENNKLMDSSTTLDIKSIIDNAIEINHGTIGSDEMNFTSTINSNSVSSNNSGCSHSNGIHKDDSRECCADENSYNMSDMCSNNDHNSLAKNNRRSIYINNNNIQNFKKEIEQDKLFNPTNFSFHTSDQDKNCNDENEMNNFFWKECNNSNSGNGNNDDDILSQGQTGYKNMCNDMLYKTNAIYDIYKNFNSIKNNNTSIDNCNQRTCEGNYSFSNGAENSSSNNFDNDNYDFKAPNNDILFNNINNEKTEDIHKLTSDTINYGQQEQINFTDIDINKFKNIFNNQNMEMLNNNSYMKNMKYKEIDAIEKDLESHIKVLWNLRKIKLGESCSNTK
ncbi:RNA-binding protein, putative [Plasmodium chabaudi chabaudi]|uniref:RNA-binding protein, putative n=1 Tax=Plasmodium chabaudi chabaudi TaxID=31271 RepID=A0A1D3S4W9_PLACU|nr:RNA-binding protein, putative [Plasmodium chabaudi chabaudi]